VDKTQGIALESAHRLPDACSMCLVVSSLDPKSTEVLSSKGFSTSTLLELYLNPADLIR